MNLILRYQPPIDIPDLTVPFEKPTAPWRRGVYGTRMRRCRDGAHKQKKERNRKGKRYYNPNKTSRYSRW